MPVWTFIACYKVKFAVHNWLFFFNFSKSFETFRNSVFEQKNRGIVPQYVCIWITLPHSINS